MFHRCRGDGRLPRVAFPVFAAMLVATLPAAADPPPRADAFVAAARNGDFQAVFGGLQADPGLATAVDAWGYTALNWALTRDHGAIARILIEAGADPNSVGEDGGTPLHRACHHDRPELVAALLDHGADLAVANRWGRTPLHVAVRRNCAGVASLLVARGAPLAAVTKEGWTPLHVARRAGHPAMAALLLAAGADPEARDAEGRRPADLTWTRPPARFLPAAEAYAYQGLFRGEEAAFKVWVEDGALRLREFAPDGLACTGRDSFVCVQEPWTVVFSRSADGRVDGMAVSFIRRTVTAARRASPEYVGSRACRECHSDEHGEPWVGWLQGRHAAAYWRLATDWAAFLAQVRSQYADITDPLAADRCLLCHLPGRQDGGALYAASWRAEEGVGCEACHGPGSLYVDPAVMADRAAFLAAGGRVPDAATCRGCHRRPADFPTAADWAAVAHVRPGGG